MKLKHKFVTPTVNRAVFLYPEGDFLLANSTDDQTQLTIMGHEEATYEEGETYTVDLY